MKKDVASEPSFEDSNHPAHEPEAVSTEFTSADAPDAQEDSNAFPFFELRDPSLYLREAKSYATNVTKPKTDQPWVRDDEPVPPMPCSDFA